MPDRKSMSPTEMRDLVTAKFDAVPDWRRPARLANLLWRLNEIFPFGATLDDWIALLAIAADLPKLYDDRRDGHPAPREGNGQEDIEHLTLLAKRNPEKAFLLITGLIACHNSLRECGVPWRATVTVDLPVPD